MVDVCFGDSERGLLKCALNKKDVFVGYSDLSMGKISAGDLEEARKQWIDVFFSGLSKQERAKIAQEEKKQFLNILKRAEKGEPVRIWVAGSPDSMCGFYHLVYQLQETAKKIFVVEMPEDMGFREPGHDRSWGEADPCEIVSSLHLQRELTEKERDEIALKWVKLAEQSAELRLRINGEIKSVPPDYLDDEIFSYAPKGKFSLNKLVGEMLGRSGHIVHDGFIACRIRKMIDRGKFQLAEGTVDPGKQGDNIFLIKNTEAAQARSESDRT